MGLSKEQQAQQISGLTGSAKGDNGSPSPVARAKVSPSSPNSLQILYFDLIHFSGDG